MAQCPVKFGNVCYIYNTQSYSAMHSHQKASHRPMSGSSAGLQCRFQFCIKLTMELLSMARLPYSAVTNVSKLQNNNRRDVRGVLPQTIPDSVVWNCLAENKPQACYCGEPQYESSSVCLFISWAVAHLWSSSITILVGMSPYWWTTSSVHGVVLSGDNYVDTCTHISSAL